MTSCSEKTFHVDCHAHLYPCYDVATWINNAVVHLTGQIADEDIIPAAIVVDREGISSKDLLESAAVRGECRIEATFSDGSCMVSMGDKESSEIRLMVIPGTQSVSKEGIEVLGIGNSKRPPEKIASADQVEFVLSEGGLPCIPWSPGKWLGKRGKVVHALLDIFGPHRLSVGDISIRSQWGPPSPLLTHAKSSGFPCLLGSDCLPFKGDEAQVGRFGISIKGTPVSPSGVVPWLLDQLRDPSKVAGACGERNPPLTALYRFVKSNL